MNVAGVLRRRPLDDGVYQTDGGGRRLVQLHHRVCGAPLLGVGGLPAHVPDGPLGTLAAIQAGVGPLDAAGGGDHGHHPPVCGRPHLLLGHKVQGVAHGQIQGVAVEPHRGHAVFLGDVPGQHVHQLGVGLYGGQVHKFNAQLQAQGVDELLLGDDPVIDERLAQPLFCLLLPGQGLAQLFLRNDPGGDQQVAQLWMCHDESAPIILSVPRSGNERQNQWFFSPAPVR